MKFELRSPFSFEDHEWLCELHNDPVVLRNMNDPKPITILQHIAWWKRVESDKHDERLIFYVDDVRVGFAKFIRMDFDNHCCLLGADIQESHRGKGYAKHLWSMMLDRCFSVHKMHRVALLTAEYNLIGQRVYKNLGFQEEGRNVHSLFRDGKYYDCICMYMLDSDWAKHEHTS